MAQPLLSSVVLKGRSVDLMLHKSKKGEFAKDKSGSKLKQQQLKCTDKLAQFLTIVAKNVDNNLFLWSAEKDHSMADENICCKYVFFYL